VLLFARRPLSSPGQGRQMHRDIESNDESQRRSQFHEGRSRINPEVAAGTFGMREKRPVSPRSKGIRRQSQERTDGAHKNRDPRLPVFSLRLPPAPYAIDEGGSSAT